MPVRKVKAGYSNLTARVPSEKLSRMADAESSLERDFILLLEHNGDVVTYEEQPLTIKYGALKYTPDVLVQYSDGSRVLFEIKYRNELEKNWEKLKPKFKAAIKYGKQNGIKFKIMTDVEIRTPYLKNLEFLSHFNRTVSPVESSMSETLLSTLGLLGTSTPRELLVACFSNKMQQAEAAPVLWRLIFNKNILTNLDLPLSMYSQLNVDPSLGDIF
ncbi:TnsA endonuclease N-terminal domain-containing protein [Pseudoalteromonas sp. OOF1S-7]|uniref:TnsA endonuclease N-terminal domain-containing protein n=1 Tax=Pseudoalteromonas sp. OOF1S-7 TaxID=2917757 RepID=UPI001EF7411D|nr:TnsA endonuclease N-terminal domain-containing protein [Pseudoalteromonas sp. OOF1S-7]MCG7535803.1 TnsA endonuclease N-terminal domain-containing protein [Pseudoalteromonas sp. OOF1S-7]